MVDFVEAFEGASTASLDWTDVISDVMYVNGAKMRRIVVSYCLSTPTDDFVHMYEFYTCFDSNHGEWDYFIDVITRVSESDSILFHAKRNGRVMSEFTNLCMRDKEGASAA